MKRMPMSETRFVNVIVFIWGFSIGVIITVVIK